MQFAEPLSVTDASIDAAWDYRKDRWQPRIIRKMEELEPTMIRFGGAFAAYYHWMEGVGPRDQRAPMLNVLWDGIYPNQVGTDEIMQLCRAGHSEPLFVVNFESEGKDEWANPKPGMNRCGSAEEAAAWVRYCNDPDNALRKEHGIVAPYNVKYWQIGNETSYEKGCFDMEVAAKMTQKFAKAMHEADSSVKLLAWADNQWSARMVEEAGDNISYLAFHYHFGSGLPDSPLTDTEYHKDPEKTWMHLMNAYKSVEEKIDEKRAEFAPLGKRMAMTESHFYLPGRNRCDVLSSWAAGVAYARCYNVLERATDILDIATMADFFGNRWQQNAIMLPTPEWEGNAYFQPVGEVAKLFRHHIGAFALDIGNTSDLDMTASISEDGKTIYVHAANINHDHPAAVDFTVDGLNVREFTVFQLHASPEDELTPQKPDVITYKEETVSGSSYVLPAAAVAAFEIKLA